MRNKKNASSKNARRGPESSHQKLAENFLAGLDRTWQQHGREVLARVGELYFQAMVRLTVVLHRRLPEPPGFDRRQYRADVLQRLQQRTENAKHELRPNGGYQLAGSLLRPRRTNVCRQSGCSMSSMRRLGKRRSSVLIAISPSRGRAAPQRSNGRRRQMTGGVCLCTGCLTYQERRTTWRPKSQMGAPPARGAETCGCLPGLVPGGHSPQSSDGASAAVGAARVNNRFCRASLPVQRA